MAQTNIAHLLEKDETGRYGKHHKKTTLDGTRGEDGWRKTSCTGHGLESEGKRKRGRPRKNWQETIREYIDALICRGVRHIPISMSEHIPISMSEAIDLAEDREGWKDCVARCAAMHWML